MRHLGHLPPPVQLGGAVSPERDQGCGRRLARGYLVELALGRYDVLFLRWLQRQMLSRFLSTIERSETAVLLPS